MSEQNQATSVSLYDIDDLSAHHCGYCNQNGNISIGMTSEEMQIQDYQTLIDRGWRRSGTYLYKPVMDKTCCPLYTIKCDVKNFVLKNSQKNTLITMRKYLEKDCKKQSNTNSKRKSESENGNGNLPISPIKKSTAPKITNQSNSKETHAKRVIKFILENNELSTDMKINELLNIPKLKAKHKRLFKKLAKLKAKDQIKDQKDVDKFLKKRKTHTKPTFESYFLTNATDKNKLTIKLVRSWPPSKEFQETLNEEHNVYVRYQTTVHKDSPLECNMRQFQRFLCTSPLLPLSHKNGPLNEATKLDIANKNLDKDFLNDLPSLGYGSFHQQYRINGKLIGVGVIDILDRCISSVYFFYDPEYNFLNLGTYSALREIHFTRQLNKLDPQLNSYYLGFYVHSCRKMRYKGQFVPSYLACPETFTWHPIESCFELIEKTKYSRFSPSDAVDSNEFIDLKDVRIRAKFRDREAKIFTFREFCRFLNNDFVPQFTHLINGYCKLFGRQFSKRVMIKF